MSLSQRRKGATWEQQQVSLFRRSGWINVERSGSGHNQRHGDLLGVPGWYLEAKNCRQFELGAWSLFAAEMAAHTGCRWALLVKRPRHPQPEDGYAVMPIGAFIQLLQEAGY